VKGRAREHGVLTRELGEVRRQLDRGLQSILNGEVDPKRIGPKVNALYECQETLEATLRVAPSEDIAILHPRAADRYRQKVAAIHEALKRGEPASREAIALIRDLVQAINV
jgi:site-specific DNA recombinase